MKLLVAGRHEVFEHLQTDKDSPGIVSPGQIVGKDGRDGSSKEVFLAGGIVQGKTMGFRLALQPELTLVDFAAVL
jgi:hypothetical protein